MDTHLLQLNLTQTLCHSLRMLAGTQRHLVRLYRAAKSLRFAQCTPIDRFLDLCLQASASLGPLLDVNVGAAVAADPSSKQRQSLILRRWRLRPLVVLARAGRFDFVREGNPLGEGEVMRREEVWAQLLRIIDAV